MTLGCDSVLMEIEDAETAWLCTYDAVAGWCTLTSALAFDHNGVIELDEQVSDPDGSFMVYTGRSGTDLLVRVRISDTGHVFLNTAFNWTLIGPMTLWPNVVPRFTWVSHGDLWTDGERPTRWAGR